jgi:hemerythrin-like domain-containing protein
MALVHNVMIRGLNAIYLQAPHIPPSDTKAFCQFMLHWHSFLSIHHSGEEAEFFPDLEEMAGDKGIMSVNVDQHHAFHEALEAFRTYIAACAGGKDVYDGAKVVRLIDGFGATLVEHLADEIPSIEGLRKYGEERMRHLPARFGEEGKKNMQALGLRGLSAILTMIDIHFEGDLWVGFPPAPGLLIWALRNVVYWFDAKTLKFAPCDRHGKLKGLYAVPKEEK